MKKEVSVFVPAYNHAAYIAQALDSILMQEVTFPYEIVIHDDASTDGTTEIIREYEARYPDIIKCRYQKNNQLSHGNLFATWDCQFEMCSGKYCAMLEGDDYWTDKHKLQCQYDYMEAHPECALYMHNAWRLDVRTGEKTLLNTFPESGYYAQREQVLCGLGSKFPATASFFFVMDLLRTDFPWFVVGTNVGDYPIRQILANRGQVYYDETPMSVYRYMTSGSFMKNIRENMDAYLTYITKMCVFYKKFSEYLDNRFDDIYSKKIDSDILGMAAATCDCRECVPEVEQEWFTEKLNYCYRLLDGEQWVGELKRQIGEKESVWIYGTSTLAAICKRSLDKAGTGVKGFVVSDGYSKPDSFEECQVKYFSETGGQNSFYVAAAQPINQNSIEQVLISGQEKRYFFPYVIKKEVR